MGFVLLFLTAKVGPAPAMVAPVRSTRVIATMAKTDHLASKSVIIVKMCNAIDINSLPSNAGPFGNLGLAFGIVISRIWDSSSSLNAFRLVFSNYEFYTASLLLT